MFLSYMGNHTILFENYNKNYKRNKFYQLLFRRTQNKLVEIKIIIFLKSAYVSIRYGEIILIKN